MKFREFYFPVAVVEKSFVVVSENVFQNKLEASFILVKTKPGNFLLSSWVPGDLLRLVSIYTNCSILYVGLFTNGTFFP